MSNPNSPGFDEYDIQEIAENSPYAKIAKAFMQFVFQKHKIKKNAVEIDIATIHIIKLMKHLKREEKSVLNDLERMQ